MKVKRSPITFFDRQKRIKNVCYYLLVLELLFIGFLAAASYFLLLGLIYLVSFLIFKGSPPFDASLSSHFNINHLAIVTSIFLVIVLTASYQRFRLLRKGGVAIARYLGCRRIYPSTENDREKMLLNIIDEISIASGMVPPLVYVIQDEHSINAFAAGWHTDGAVIAFSTGALKFLTRDELQGIAAHEMSHILNGDLRLNIVLSSVVHGLNLLYVFGRRLLDIKSEAAKETPEDIMHAYLKRRHSREDNILLAVAYVVGIFLLVYGLIGRFFASLLSAAFSRQREFLADASAVQYTRHPQALAQALKKIGGQSLPSTLLSMYTDSLDHFFFVKAADDLFSGFLSSHPPLSARIIALDSAFDGQFIEPSVVDDYEGRHLEASYQEKLLKEMSQTKFRFFAAQVSDIAGTIGLSPHSAQTILAGIPSPLRTLVSEPYGARAVVYALLLDKDEERMMRQIDEVIFKEDDRLVRDKTALAIRLVRKLDLAYRLPLFDLCIPALHELAKDEYLHFLEILDAISQSKTSPDSFDHAVGAIIERQLSSRLFGNSKAMHTPSPKELYESSETVIFELSRYAGDASVDITKAYVLAREFLGMPEVPPSKIASKPNKRSLREALASLSSAHIRSKEKILRACALSIEHDGQASVVEMELLRAVSEALGVPLPPLFMSD